MPLNTSKEQVAIDDQHVVAACLDGRMEMFGLLVRKYQDRLFQTVRHVVGSEEDARDVVQDAFVKAFQSLQSFRQQSSFYTWLYRIAVNTALSHQRRRRPMAVLVSADAAGGEAIADGSADGNPASRLERQEQIEQVRAAIQRLSPEHRAVLLLREIDGQSYEQIAQVLECPVGTVRSRLFRARMELRSMMENFSGAAPAARPAPGQKQPVTLTSRPESRSAFGGPKPDSSSSGRASG